MTCPKCGGPARRETDTMDTFVDSSWYFLRFCDPKNDRAAVRSGDGRRTGCRSTSTAAASSTRSCTCSTRASSRACCATSGWSNFDEPFKRLLTQGMVLKNGAVMSKSKGNVVDPDDMLQKYGADALRLYVMFVAPPEKEVEWSDAGLEGSFRFLVRVWRLVDHWAETIGGEGIPACGDDCTDAERALRRKTHDTIRRVTGRHRRADAPEHRGVVADGAGQRALRVQRGDARTARRRAPSRRPARVERAQTIAVLREAIDALVVMMSPFAPHTAEELWQMLGHAGRPGAGDVAVVRSRGRQGGRGRRAGAGQRQGARAAHGAGRR